MNDIFCLRTTNTNKVVLIDADESHRFKDQNWQESPQNYIYRCEFANIVMLLHRAILKVRHKSRAVIIDHKNNCRFDNRKCNLVICNQSQNTAKKFVDKTQCLSKYRGVTKTKNRIKCWQAQITINYAHKNLGYYSTEQEAAIAYNNAAIKYFGEFAKLNVI